MQRKACLPHAVELVSGSLNYWLWIAHYYLFCPASHWEWQTASSRPIEREVIATRLHRKHIERVFKSQAHKSGGLASITASLESKWLFTVVLPNCPYSPLLFSLVHQKATRNQHGRGGLSASQNNCWQLLGCLDIGERDRLYVEIQRVVSEWVCLNQWRLRWD